jgi:hypothetical protein
MGQMRTTRREDVPLRSGWNFGIVTVLAVIGFGVLVFLEKAARTDDVRSSMSEAAAGLMAAILAVIVSHLSHRQGRARGVKVSKYGKDGLRPMKEGALLFGLSILLVAVAIFAAWRLRISIAAAAALVAAVLAYALADFLSDVSSTVRTRREWGLVLIPITLAVAVVGIWLNPSAAEAVAAIAAVFVTFGGSLLGHAQGSSE